MQQNSQLEIILECTIFQIEKVGVQANLVGYDLAYGCFLEVLKATIPLKVMSQLVNEYYSKHIVVGQFKIRHPAFRTELYTQFLNRK